MKKIALEKIKPNPDQPRKVFDKKSLIALSESIKEYGLLQPILVKLLKDGNYQIVVGERRYRAHFILGRKTIECSIYEGKEEFILSIVENVQREDLSPIEEADAYKKLLDAGVTQTEFGKKIGKSQSLIAQKLALLKLPIKIMVLLKNRKLSEGQARLLLKFKKSLEMFEISEDKKDWLIIRCATYFYKMSVSEMKEFLDEDYYYLIDCALLPFYEYGNYRGIGDIYFTNSVYQIIGNLELLRHDCTNRSIHVIGSKEWSAERRRHKIVDELWADLNIPGDTILGSLIGEDIEPDFGEGFDELSIEEQTETEENWEEIKKQTVYEIWVEYQIAKMAGLGGMKDGEYQKFMTDKIEEYKEILKAGDFDNRKFEKEVKRIKKMRKVKEKAAVEKAKLYNEKWDRIMTKWRARKKAHAEKEAKLLNGNNLGDLNENKNQKF